MKVVLTLLLLAVTVPSFSKTCNISRSKIQNIEKQCKPGDILVLNTSTAKVVGSYCDHTQAIAVIPAIKHKFDRQTKTMHYEVSRFSSSCIFRKN